MCAINGFNFKDEGLIKKMIQSTKHRGPDQDGYFCDQNISLGSARLCINDLSKKGRQPVWNEDKSICLVLNGEIYNFKELQSDLQKRGHQLYSNSDSEVIVHMYEDYGVKCLDFFNGIFAFALYDKSKEELFLARDRVGVKPLYYYFDRGKLIFSSEIKAILDHSVPRVVDETALRLYFKLFYVPAPFTMFKNIFKLKPAHYAIFKNGSLRIERYWDVIDDDSARSKEEVIHGIQGIMRDAVKRQLLTSDRPVGIFLSGGIDSTSVLGCASECSRRIKTYSVGFYSDKPQHQDPNSHFHTQFNRDFFLARKTSAIYDTDHHELIIKDKDILDSFEKTVWHMDEPNPNVNHIPTFLLAKEAKKDVAVVLGGDGGDELFGGYPRYYYSSLLDRYQMLPEFLRRGLLPILLERILRKRNLNKKLNTPQTLDRYLLFMSEHNGTLRDILSPEIMRSIDDEKSLESYFPQNKFKDFGKYLMYLDFTTWFAEESLIRSDKMTMAHGLEERVPILDHRLVELAFKIPTSWKVGRGNRNKLIFRQAMAKYLPDFISDKDKRGWFAPASTWLRGAMHSYAYEALSPNYCIDTQEYFNFNNIKRMLDEHVCGERYNMHTLWSLMTFQVWYRKFVKHHDK